jgi:hypothetical protein
MRIVLSTDELAIKESWILDDEVNSHICNSIMHSRFMKKRDVFSDEWLAFENRSLKIETYDTIDIILQISTDLKLMTLLNVAYVSNFMTNAVSQNLLYVKDVYFDNNKLHLH